MIRQRAWGAAPLLLILLVVVALTLAFFYFAKGQQAQHPGIAAMAGMPPADTRLFAAADLEGRLEPARTAAKLKAWLQEFPEARSRLEQTEDFLGLPLEKLSAWFHPVAFVAVFPGGEGSSDGVGRWNVAGEALLAVAALRVGDEESLRGYLAQRFGAGEERSLAGSTFRLFGEGHSGWGYGFHQGYLFLGLGQGALERFFEGKDPLAGDPLFQGARRQVRVEQGFFVYVPIAATLERELARPEKEQPALEALRSLLYFAAAGEIRSTGSLECFLRVDPGADPWAEVLQGDSQVAGAGARFVPVEWNNYTAFNLRYVGNVLMKTAELAPEVPEPLGLLPVLPKETRAAAEELWKASTGELSFSSDLLLGSNQATSVPTLVLVLSLKDVDRARAALEQAGGEPAAAAAKIRSVPGVPQAHYFLAEQPSAVLVAAWGPDSLKQLEKVADVSRDKSTSMAASPLFQQALTEAGVPGTVVVTAMNLEGIRTRQPSSALKPLPRLEGTSFVRVETDGIRWKSRGMVGIGIAAAVTVRAARQRPAPSGERKAGTP